MHADVVAGIDASFVHGELAGHGGRDTKIPPVVSKVMLARVGTCLNHILRCPLLLILQ